MIRGTSAGRDPSTGAMTQLHPLDDADLVDFGDGEDFEGDLSDDFAADEDFAEDEVFAADEDLAEDEVFAADEDLAEDEVFAADEDLAEDDDLVGDADAGPVADDAAAVEDDDDDDVPLPADDDDDEEVHPSDVEADLEEILRDRIAASDDDEDDEDNASGQPKTVSVAPPRPDEWTCNQCFLIVSMTQFGSRTDPVCPSGEEPCESMKRISSG